jgi:hypothetical protein
MQIHILLTYLFQLISGQGFILKPVPRNTGHCPPSGEVFAKAADQQKAPGLNALAIDI